MNSNDEPHICSNQLDPLFLFSFPNSQRLRSSQDYFSESRQFPNSQPKSKRRNIKIYNLRGNRRRLASQIGQQNPKQIPSENSENQAKIRNIESKLKKKYAQKAPFNRPAPKYPNAHLTPTSNTIKFQPHRASISQPFIQAPKYFRKCRLCHHELALEKKQKLSQRVLMGPLARLVFEFLDVRSMRVAKLANRFFYEVARRCEEERDEHFYYSLSNL